MRRDSHDVNISLFKRIAQILSVEVNLLVMEKLLFPNIQHFLIIGIAEREGECKVDHIIQDGEPVTESDFAASLVALYCQSRRYASPTCFRK